LFILIGGFDYIAPSQDAGLIGNVIQSAGCAAELAAMLEFI
jgi:hypothetical protein